MGYDISFISYSKEFHSCKFTLLCGHYINLARTEKGFLFANNKIAADF